jgi:hypothetical protein
MGLYGVASLSGFWWNHVVVSVVVPPLSVDHPNALVGGLQDLQDFLLTVAVLPGDGLEVLLRHTHLT